MARDTRIQDLFGVELPIVQAPMAGSQGSALAIAVSNAGGLGSLPCAMLSPAQALAEATLVRESVAGRPLNLNFFCHTPPEPDAAREAAWRAVLTPYYAEFGVDPAAILAGPGRAPFDEALCEVVEAVRPAVVSFHFGLPSPALVGRVKATGAKVISSATTVEEARWLEANGCDAIIAQGIEAGGHRGMFLAQDIAGQVGTFALLPQVVDAATVPVIAAGGIGDARGIAAAFLLGASGVQLGTAYLRCPESTISPVHRAALETACEGDTALTNIFSGRPARGIMNRLMREIGPITDAAPEFPQASGAIGPLRTKAEAAGSGDFSPLWAGQAAALARDIPAAEVTRTLAAEALALLGELFVTTKKDATLAASLNIRFNG